MATWESHRERARKTHYAKHSRKGLGAGSDAAGHWRPYPPEKVRAPGMLARRSDALLVGIGKA
jgi:hypothetical protein